MEELPASELEKLPYVNVVPLDGRIVPLRTFYDDTVPEWVLMVRVAPAKLGRLKGGEPVLGGYFARRAAEPDRDLQFPLSTFVAQHASFPGVIGPVQSIEWDFHHFCSILETYELITSRLQSAGTSDLLLKTQLESLILLVRQVYDHLQKTSKQLSLRILAPDGSGRRVIADLPDSFARMVLDGDRIRDKSELVEKFRLTEPIADFYVIAAPRFKLIRDLRVSIEHHGKNVETIFNIAHGAAVMFSDPPWSDLGPWDPRLIREEKFGSLRGLFARMMLDTINMTNQYAEAFASRIVVPQALGDNVRVYLRNPFGRHLVDLAATIEDPWERKP